MKNILVYWADVERGLAVLNSAQMPSGVRSGPPIWLNLAHSKRENALYAIHVADEGILVHDRAHPLAVPANECWQAVLVGDLRRVKNVTFELDTADTPHREFLALYDSARTIDPNAELQCLGGCPIYTRDEALARAFVCRLCAKRIDVPQGVIRGLQLPKRHCNYHGWTTDASGGVVVQARGVRQVARREELLCLVQAHDAAKGTITFRPVKETHDERVAELGHPFVVTYENLNDEDFHLYRPGPVKSALARHAATLVTEVRTAPHWDPH